MGSDVKIARALISVTDKTGVVDFARTLVDDFGVEIISTGGTARAHILITYFPFFAPKPTTFIAQKLDFRLLLIRQRMQIFKPFIQPEIRHHITKLVPL